VQTARSAATPPAANTNAPTLAVCPRPRAHKRQPDRQPHRGEIVDRAVRAYDLRSLLAQTRERSDLDEDQALALAREELKAARAERDAA
jgi:hypothetical protein